MLIEKTFYGLQKTEITFTLSEVKTALIEYMLKHNKESLPDNPDTIDSSTVDIYEAYEGEEAKAILTIDSRKLEKNQ